jgi:hypothetical protein
MRGPTCVVWANLAPLSPQMFQAAVRRHHFLEGGGVPADWPQHHAEQQFNQLHHQVMKLVAASLACST